MIEKKVLRLMTVILRVFPHVSSESFGMNLTLVAILSKPLVSVKFLKVPAKVKFFEFRTFAATPKTVKQGSQRSSGGFGRMTGASPNRTFRFWAGLAGQQDKTAIGGRNLMPATQP